MLAQLGPLRYVFAMEFDRFLSGEGRTLPMPAALAFLAFLVVTASVGCYQYLWVFPADAGGLPLWILLYRAVPAFCQARILLWGASELFEFFRR